MIITANISNKFIIDISSLERLDDFGIEKQQFRLTLAPGKSANVNDQWLNLINVQAALKKNYISISNLTSGDVKIYE